MKVSVDRRMKGFPIKSSCLDSCVRWFKQTTVPEADSISIARGLDGSTATLPNVYAHIRSPQNIQW